MRPGPVYLDHHAATPLGPGVADAMRDVRERAWANPSSVHSAGRAARAVLEQGRDVVAAALGVSPAETVLTGGGTEAVNLGVRGLVAAEGSSGRVLTTALEHPAVSGAAALAARAANGRVETLSFAADALPDAATLGSRLGPGDVLAMTWVHHETGVILPVAQWAAAARDAGARVFVDATQALGKVDLALAALPVDAAAFAAQKVGGPAGAGALYARRGVSLAAVTGGGGQERGRRPGTPDVAAHAGFARALASLPERLRAMSDIGRRRDAIESAAVAAGASVNGLPLPRVATVSHVAFPGRRADVLVASLDVEGVCVSAGAACSSGVQEPLASVRALHPEEPWRATSSVRFSLGPSTTDDDVSSAIEVLERVLARG